MYTNSGNGNFNLSESPYADQFQDMINDPSNVVGSNLVESMPVIGGQPLPERHIHHTGPLDNEWNAFRQTVSDYFLSAISGDMGETLKRQLYIIEWGEDDPFDIMLSFIPEEYRHRYICHACKRFLNRYAMLCTITDNGLVKSALFPELNESDREKLGVFYDYSCKMKSIIESSTSRVKRIFMKMNKVILGDASVNEELGYSHLHVDVKYYFDRADLKTYEMADFQRAALANNLRHYHVETLIKTKNLIEGNILFRGQKYAHAIDLYIKYKTAIVNLNPLDISHRERSARQNNIIWKFFQVARDGIWNINNTVIGQFMDKLENGEDIGESIQFYNNMIDPMYYQRPQNTKPISSGSADRAFKIMNDLGIRPTSLDRRFAIWDEVKSHAIWVSNKKKDDEPVIDNTKNPFTDLTVDHRKGKFASKTIVATKNITFDDLMKLLNDGKIISLSVEKQTNQGMQMYLKDAYAITAPEFEDNDPIFYYDTPEFRNPYAWFTTSNGGSWRMNSNSIIGILPLPNIWNPNITNKQGFTGYVFVVKDIYPTFDVSYCLFPELIRNEFREVRSVIEAYSNAKRMEKPDKDRQLAAGFIYVNGRDAGSNEIPLIAEYDDYYIRYKLF